MLDFDFEKLCSVSLSRINVYACLVCGKYFQGDINICVYDCIFELVPIELIILLVISAGRGTNTHAYTHSVAESHHVFLNLQTLKFYCLPDNYEIVGQLEITALFYYRILFHLDIIMSSNPFLLLVSCCVQILRWTTLSMC